MEKVSTESKSGGTKKLRLRTADSVAGLSEKDTLKIAAKSHRLRSFNLKFKNNAIPRSVRLKKNQIQHQIYKSLLQWFLRPPEPAIRTRRNDSSFQKVD